jgi:uncharacterized surface protein with fasciclin (FAS1) repeats
MTRPPPPALPPGHEPIVYATREEAREAALAEARRIHYEEEVLDRSYDIVTRPPRTKPMPSFPEPSRNKTHWDHLLEEMKWLAGDFVRERKFRMKLAKKAAHAVARSNLDLESRVIKRRLDEAAAARKKARRVASEVMQFWIKIEKVVRFKAQSAIDSKRKEVMDKHLDFMMQQTERYSTMLATKLGGDADADAANANATRDVSVLVAYHVVPNVEIASLKTDVKRGDLLRTALGSEWRLMVDAAAGADDADDAADADAAFVVRGIGSQAGAVTTMRACNGVIHVVDRVLLPTDVDGAMTARQREHVSKIEATMEEEAREGA